MMRHTNPILKNYCYVARELKNTATLQLLNILADYDENTLNHSLRVAHKSVDIGCKMNLNHEELTMLTRAAILHDIGKIYIPHDIIDKPSALTDREYEIIKQHTILGADYAITLMSNEPRIANVIQQHHENFDGSGYPHKLANEQIDIFARIIRIADTYDAMSSDRPYQPMVPNHVIYELFSTDFGHCFDPDIVKLL